MSTWLPMTLRPERAELAGEVDHPGVAGEHGLLQPGDHPDVQEALERQPQRGGAHEHVSLLRGCALAEVFVADGVRVCRLVFTRHAF